MPSLRCSVLCCLALLSKTKGMIPSRSASTLSSQILHRVAVCNRSPSKPLIPFNLAESVNLDNPLGLVDEEVVATIVSSSPSSFAVSAGDGLVLTDSTVAAQNAALAKASLALRERGLIKAWRDELSPFVNSFSDITREYKSKGRYEGLVIERGAAALFSCRGFGVHVNGYVKGETMADLKLWVGKRSEEKGVCPGMLDHIVAGGIPASHPLPSENVVKECGEEAGIPEDIAEKAEAVGMISYNGMDTWAWEGRIDQDGTGEGYKRDVLFCYDLEIPPDFVPKPVDGEVSGFELVGIEEVMKTFEAGRGVTETYKANDYLVIADFLVRRGYVRPEDDDYTEIVQSLRVT
ncbi:hypothetical protein TrST_g9967 [Triparma strigata]|uniref:Nudix hydrolase domain-containing protein n=1 Tax=Triparma strigata TaxID=1606541 RepID=A0A9W7EPF8_9STRA|nr:hypothetical protein TrST_g9967 [Triparma strigata]